MKSTVLIVPAAHQAAANAVAEAMGWGPNNYSVPLVTGEVVTHYGLHTQSSEQFEGWVKGTTPLPEGMESAQAVIDVLTASFSATLNGRAHFDAVLDANGLEPVVSEL